MSSTATRLRIDHETDAQFRRYGASVQVEFVDQDTVRVSILDQLDSGVPFVIEDAVLIRSGDGYFDNANPFLGFGFTDPETDPELNGQFAGIFGIQAVNRPNPGIIDAIYAVIGSDTLDLPTDGTAQFRGGAVIHRSTVGSNQVETLFNEAVVELEANFLAGSIDGSISFDDIIIQMSEPAAISGNEFSSTLVSASDGYVVTNPGVIEGKFYGPNAEEVGGSFGYSYSDGENTGAVSGVFHADQ